MTCFLQELSTRSPVLGNGIPSWAVKWQILWKSLVVVWQLVLVTLSRSDRSWLQFGSFLCFNEARVPFLSHSFLNYCAEQPIVIEPNSLLNVILLDISWCLMVPVTTILTSDILFDSNKTALMVHIFSSFSLQFTQVHYNFFLCYYFTTT